MQLKRGKNGCELEKCVCRQLSSAPLSASLDALGGFYFQLIVLQKVLSGKTLHGGASASSQLL